MRELIERLESIKEAGLTESRLSESNMDTETLEKVGIDPSLVAKQLDHENPIIHTRYFISDEVEYVEEIRDALNEYLKMLDRVNRMLPRNGKFDDRLIAKIKKEASL